MDKIQLKIFGVRDVQWPGFVKYRTANGTFYYSGNGDPAHRYGVGIIVEKEVDKTVVNFTPYSDLYNDSTDPNNKGKLISSKYMLQQPKKKMR